MLVNLLKFFHKDVEVGLNENEMLRYLVRCSSSNRLLRNGPLPLKNERVDKIKILTLSAAAIFWGNFWSFSTFDIRLLPGSWIAVTFSMTYLYLKYLA